MNIVPTQSNLEAALRAFILSVLPATGSDGNPIAVVSGLPNLVAEPQVSNFVVMTPIMFERLGTNIDSLQTAQVNGSISGTILTVTSLVAGSLVIGMALTGTATGTATISSQITGTISGTGGVGTYTITPTVNGTGTFFGSAKTIRQSARATVQLDFHAADTTASDMAQTVSTTLRDEFGTTFFAGLPPPLNGISPIHADDPTMTPFVNDQNQYEWRLITNAQFQVEDTVVVPVEYGTFATITLESVEALFPPH